MTDTQRGRSNGDEQVGAPGTPTEDVREDRKLVSELSP